MYNLKIKNIYKKPQSSTVKKDWSKQDYWSSATYYSILAEKNLPNRVKINNT